MSSKRAVWHDRLEVWRESGESVAALSLAYLRVRSIFVAFRAMKEMENDVHGASSHI